MVSFLLPSTIQSVPGRDVILGLVIAALCAGGLRAGEFRELNIVRTPPRGPAGSRTFRNPATGVLMTLPPEFADRAMPQFRPVPRERVVLALQDLAEDWNQGRLDRHLSDRFFDKTRLVDNVDQKVARDARIQILAIQGIQTLSQLVREHPSNSSQVRVESTVSVTARHQILFNAAGGDFQRIEGTNEYIFEFLHDHDLP